MRARLTAVQIAEDVFEIAVDTPADAQRLALELRKIGLAEDVVAGINRVAVSFDPARHDQVMAWMDDLPQTVPTNEAPPPAVDIPIQYGGEFGPDLANVCAALGMTQAAFVDLHSSCTHAVDMIGFTPGFTYISGLPDSVSVPRLDMPRPRLIAGSVGISGALTGIYALAGPGGWPLIGHTSVCLFDKDRESPFLLAPLQTVRFVPI